MRIATLLLIIFVTFSPLTSFADTIKSFDVEVVLNKDNSANITETIRYNFSESGKHGIYRTIPEDFRPAGNLSNINIKIKNITDETGRRYEFSDRSVYQIDLKIGDPDVFVSPEEIYIIEYEVKNVIGFFENNDEFYWNVTGNEWDVDAIENVSLKVTLPADIDGDVATYSYCGPSGSLEQCGNFDIDGEAVYFNKDLNYNIGRRSGVTIDLEFPKGIIDGPSKFTQMMYASQRTVSILLGLIIFIFLAHKQIKNRFALVKRYKKFKSNHPDLVQYDPGEFTVIEASFFHDGVSSQGRDISGFVVDLAIKGYLVIRNEDGTYYFDKTLKNTDSLNKAEVDFINILSEYKMIDRKGKKILVDKDVSLKRKNLKYTNKVFDGGVKDIFNFYGQNIINKGYVYLGDQDDGKATSTKIYKYSDIFLTHINKRNTIYVAVLCLFLSIFPIQILKSVSTMLGLTLSFACIWAALYYLISSYPIIPKYTESGMKASWYIKGLYKYIKMSEKHRIEVMNAPEKTPVLFEKLLPYAIVFGLEKKWAREFKGIYKDLYWYKTTEDKDDDGWRDFNAFSSGFARGVYNTASNSMSSSGGMSGGGGSSGGGGGGGGGGSW